MEIPSHQFSLLRLKLNLFLMHEIVVAGKTELSWYLRTIVSLPQTNTKRDTIAYNNINIQLSMKTKTRKVFPIG